MTLTILCGKIKDILSTTGATTEACTATGVRVNRCLRLCVQRPSAVLPQLCALSHRTM